MRCRLCSLCASVMLGLAGVADGPASAADQPPGPSYTTVALSSQEPVSQGRVQQHALLVRELFRQAVLIAARNELGLATRDMALAETLGDADSDDVLAIEAQTSSEFLKSLGMRLSRRGEADAAAALYELRLPWFGEKVGRVDYPALVEALEPLSRKEIVEALGKAGAKPRVVKPPGTVAVPADIELALGEMNVFSQFAAVRALHNLQRSDGQSPQTLAVLVRGYANLGQLTAFAWNAAPKVFKARALIYAERLVNADKQSAWSLNHRGYACALAGLHAAALADFNAGEDARRKEEATLIAWVPLVKAYCLYERQAVLDAAKSEGLGELGALLSFLVVENSGCQALTISAGRDSLQAVPECYSICDAICRDPGVSIQHVVTVHGPAMLQATLAKRLAALPNLPATLRTEFAQEAREPQGAGLGDAAFSGGPQRVALIDALVAAGAVGEDDGEPSWQVIGRLVDDLTLVHAYRRLAFFQGGLGFPPAAYKAQLDVARKLVAKHPYAKILDCTVLDGRREAQQIDKLLGEMQIVDEGLPWFRLAARVQANDRATISTALNIRKRIGGHQDPLADDIERARTVGLGSGSLPWLSTVSPHDPLAIVAQIEGARPNSTPEFWQDLEKRYKDQPVIMRALGIWHYQHQQWPDAERCLARFVELSPDQAGFAWLADVQLKQNDRQKWQETLEKSLAAEDFALSHAKTRSMLARYFMTEKQFDKALPYADAAAETGAGWAMLLAAECHQHLEHWTEAEALIRQTAERYPGQELDWYFWCRKTGHGEEKQALQFAMRQVSVMSRRNDAEAWSQLGTLFWLSDQLTAARTAYQKSFQKQGNPWIALMLAEVCDEGHDAKLRDATVAQVVTFFDKLPPADGAAPAAEANPADKTNPKAPQPPGGFTPQQLAQLRSSVAGPLARWLQQAYSGSADAAAADEWLAKAVPMERSGAACLIGRYYRHAGEEEKARKYLQLAVDSQPSARLLGAVATVNLRELSAATEPAAP